MLLTLCCGSRRIRMVVLRSHRTASPSEASTTRYKPTFRIVYLISGPSASSITSYVPFANLISALCNEQFDVSSTNSYPLKCIHFIWYMLEAYSSNMYTVCNEVIPPVESWQIWSKWCPVVPHGMFSVITRKVSSTVLLPHLFLKKQNNNLTSQEQHTLTLMLVFTENRVEK